MRNRQKTIKNDPVSFSGASFSPPILSFLKWVPNGLTILRLLGAPLSFWSILHNRLTLAFWLFFSVSITDWVDGYLARRWHVISKLGQVLDPLADKALVVSMYIALGFWGFIPLWVTGLVLARDFLILIIGGGIMLQKRFSPKGSTSLFSPILLGKLCTTFQMLFIGFTLLKGAFPALATSSIDNMLMIFFLYIVAFATVLSGTVYARVAYKTLRED